MSRALGGARRTLRSATPLSRSGAGPEALRPGITAGLPWTNDGSHNGLHTYKRYISSFRAWEGSPSLCTIVPVLHGTEVNAQPVLFLIFNDYANRGYFSHD